MNKNTNNLLTSFSGHVDYQYGKIGTETIDNYEEDFESFRFDCHGINLILVK